MRTGSISRIGRSPSMATISSTPAASAIGSKARTTSPTRTSGSVGLGVEGERAGLGERQRAQVVDQAAQDPGLLEDQREVVGVGRIDAVEDRLEVALDHGERRPELVADLGQQRPALALVGLESSGHRVEPAGELADRPDALASPDAHGVVTGLDPARRLDELVEGRPGRAQRATDAGQRGHHEDEDEEPRERAEMGDDEAARRGERSEDQQEEQPEEAAEAAPRPAPAPTSPAAGPGVGRVGPFARPPTMRPGVARHQSAIRSSANRYPTP